LPGPSGYLHSVASVSPSTIVCGGEDGSVDFFDAKQRKLIESVPMKSKLPGLPKGANLWTSSLSVSGSFLSAGGGAEGVPPGHPQGWLASFHAPSRTLTSLAQSSAAINKVAHVTGHVVTAGNEAAVTYRGRADARQVAAVVPTGIEAGFALAPLVGGGGDGIAVAGAAGAVKLFEDRTFRRAFDAL
jgi:hypothetical protein